MGRILPTRRLSVNQVESESNITPIRKISYDARTVGDDGCIRLSAHQTYQLSTRSISISFHQLSESRAPERIASKRNDPIVPYMSDSEKNGHAPPTIGHL